MLTVAGWESRRGGKCRVRGTEMLDAIAAFVGLRRIGC